MVAQMAAGDWLVLVKHELFLFAGTFFLIGAIDEFAVDIVYIWLRATGRATTPRIDGEALKGAPLTQSWAVLIPAWQETGVIAATIAHACAAWPQDRLRFYVGCYRNDPETPRAANFGAGGDPRVRVVVHDLDGPTCKADCLNRLYRAVEDDERHDDLRFRAIVLHDAEDMVDPLALPLLAAAMERVQFVQLPVLALPQFRSPLVAGHYSDEFAEAHCRSMVVRSALGRGIPGAGVGCAIDRDLLAQIAAERASEGPFATGALTEDYELGLECATMGAKSQFLRVRTIDGRLIATRAFFPSSMSAAIRQKTRWTHGIAFQGWDRMGWRGGPSAIWMQLRDRRGPLAALMLTVAYLLVVLTGLDLLLAWLGYVAAAPVYGGSQAGLLVRYSLAPEGLGDTAFFVRAVRALDRSHDGDLAAGLAVRPLGKLPATIHGEVRLSSLGGKVEVRPAAFVAAGFDEQLGARGIASRGYVQAGYVGGRDATGFVDGSVVTEAHVLPLSEPRLTAGAGAWGGVQRGTGRLDVGPTASMNLRLGDAKARLSADYRFRVAGNAAPAAGAAITLSAGF